LIIEISFPAKFSAYIVEKGSIAVDGISLTTISVNKNNFSISLVEYTINNTTLAQKKINDPVNLEFDIIGKYLKKFYESR
jgi:riboflavin synthase